MKKLLLLLMIVTAIFAGECKYEATSLAVNWTAYKTPLKIGVGGTFDNVKVNTTASATTQALVNSSSVIIDTSKINSKNPSRDAKLVKFFFDVQNVKRIQAKVLSSDDKIVKVAVTMNNITKTVPMQIIYTDSAIEAKGNIDLADFHMLPSLSSLTKACFVKHQGKTWQDVEITFNIKTKKSCK